MKFPDIIMEIGIVGLLRVAWLAGILPIIIALIPFSGLNSVHHAVLVFAGRGKIIQSSSRLSKLTVPQRFFSHFYVLAVVWTSLLLLTTWAYAHNIGSLVSESTSYSNVASYLIGGSHLFPIQKTQSISPENSCKDSSAPLSLCCNFAPELFVYSSNTVAEFIVKGKKSMPPANFQWQEYLSPLLNLGWCHWVGGAIFFWGWLHQRRCHAILGHLREVKEQANDYQIPHGDWFEVVSSAHYLAEIVIYAGILVASGGLDLTVWLLLAFVVTNLVFAAAETHRWYHRKFDNYPHNRYAIIPFVY